MARLMMTTKRSRKIVRTHNLYRLELEIHWHIVYNMYNDVYSPTLAEAS